VANVRALRNRFPEYDLDSLIKSRKISDAGLYQLLELARWNLEGVRQLLKKPEKISSAYKLRKKEIDAARPKRVSASDRIERAWPGYWSRWIQKF
jgi:hypothetical protein